MKQKILLFAMTIVAIFLLAVAAFFVLHEHTYFFSDNQQTKLQPPDLKIYFPADGSTIRSSNLNFRGWAGPKATVKIKPAWDKEILATIGQSGNFSCSYLLPKRVGCVDGWLDFVFTATNENGNTVKTIRLKDPAFKCPDGWINVLNPDLKTGEIRQYPNTYSGLRLFLNGCHKMPDYLASYFDCSNSSSMLWSCLSVSGFKSSIVVGPCPWDPKLGSHAWVIVNTSDQGTIAVEATYYTASHYKGSILNKIERWLTGSAQGMIIPKSKDPDNAYYHYNYEYPDVYAAVRAYGNTDQWDWWSRLPGLREL